MGLGVALVFILRIIEPFSLHQFQHPPIFDIVLVLAVAKALAKVFTAPEVSYANAVAGCGVAA